MAQANIATHDLARSRRCAQVNMCIVLTDSAGGATASALFNAALGNILGVFLTPLLLYQASTFS